MEDLRSSYIFPEFLYLYQLTLHPSPNTPLIPTKAKYFTKLDICIVYNLIHIAEGKEWKTAFFIPYSLFESLLMPFGLTNTLARFQNYINDGLVPYLDHFYTTYLNNTLIYSNNYKEY
jgi:hypothetical protein